MNRKLSVIYILGFLMLVSCNLIAQNTLEIKNLNMDPLGQLVNKTVKLPSNVCLLGKLYNSFDVFLGNHVRIYKNHLLVKENVSTSSNIILHEYTDSLETKTIAIGKYTAVLSYNSSKQIQVVKYNYVGDTTIHRIDSFFYNPQNQLIELHVRVPSYNLGKDSVRFYYEYFPDGKLSKMVEAKNALIQYKNSGVTYYSYNATGQLVSYVRKGILSPDTLCVRDSFIYAGNGEISVHFQEQLLNASWQLNYKEVFSQVDNPKALFMFSPVQNGVYTKTIPINWIFAGEQKLRLKFSTDNGTSWMSFAEVFSDSVNSSSVFSTTQSIRSITCKLRIQGIIDSTVFIDNLGNFSFNSASLDTSGNRTAIIQSGSFCLPIDNSGILAEIDMGSGAKGATYNGVPVLFSAGFFLSGTANGKIWANGMMGASLVMDYISGSGGFTDNLPLYQLNSYFEDFHSSWLTWKKAVTFGAHFYDGDNDNIYSPIDKNHNGVWDLNEDKPDILGNTTTWCIFNDCVPAASRRFKDISPIGIDIRQTVFAYQPNLDAANIIFVKYSLTNTGTTANTLDSVYFSIACDPDLGSYSDDLVGCDTLLQTGFCYNNGPDALFGSCPPSFAATFLQGPVSYIPGVTFIDKNNNGIYDTGDIALDTAFERNGPTLGTKKYPGARNLPMSSFTEYMQNHPTHGDPSTAEELRNYQLGGLTKMGTPISACTFLYGNGNTLQNCSQINPKYMYSGDPVTGTGWLNNNPIDQRMLLNCGPFQLVKNQPVDILTAYCVGQSNYSALYSVNEVKKKVQYARKLFLANFPKEPLGIHEKNNGLARIFSLEQNYPNPFNPSTKIVYSIPSSANTTLKIYDIMGREIKTLVNEYQSAGIHELQFNASSLSSGVYFYKLQSGTYSTTKKMLFIK
ncbi:MAG: T9SS type A sorting domain-containing protein [Ignavibacteria bacterium]|nr:T9SS type A sorting domain-containing protein [Ignavibacteria bacterium]